MFLPEEFRHQQLLEKMQRRKKRLGKKDEEDRDEPSIKDIKIYGASNTAKQKTRFV